MHKSKTATDYVENAIMADSIAILPAILSLDDSMLNESQGEQLELPFNGGLDAYTAPNVYPLVNEPLVYNMRCGISTQANSLRDAPAIIQRIFTLR